MAVRSKKKKKKNNNSSSNNEKSNNSNIAEGAAVQDSGQSICEADPGQSVYEQEADRRTVDDIDSVLAGRISERRKAREKKQHRKKTLTLIALIIAFALLATMCGKDIVRLKAENRSLRKQQLALEKERDALKEELKNTGKQEYIREQARKQLRLLNPGEIMFTFEGDDE